MQKTQPSRPRAYSYVRFSTPEQARGDSLRRQTEAARRYATVHGLDLDERLSFQDLGMSAHHGRNAEVGKLGAFLAAVRDEIVPANSFLLVESLDRISRQTVRRAVRTLESIVETGVTVVDLSDNGRAYNIETLDSDPFAFVMMALRFIRAHEESATKGVRVTAAYERKRAAAAARDLSGVPFTRQLPGWLRWDDTRHAYAVIPDRARLIREMFKRADAGWGQHRIAHWLNERGIKPWGRAGLWHRSYVRKILTNPAVVGTFVPHKTLKRDGGARQRKPLDPIAGFWPAVVDRDTFERASTRVAAGAPKGRHAAAPVASIFAGVLRCAHCGGRVIRVSKGEYAYLVCSKAHAKGGCHYQAVRYADVESAILENIKVICGDAPLGEATAQFEEEAWHLNEALYRLRDEADGLVSELARTHSDAIRRRLQATEAQIKDGEDRRRFLQQQIERHSEPIVAKRVARLRDALIKRPLDVVKANGALKEAVEQIVVDAEKGMLNLSWRHRPGATHPVPFRSRHAVHTSEFPAVSASEERASSNGVSAGP